MVVHIIFPFFCLIVSRRTIEEGCKKCDEEGSANYLFVPITRKHDSVMSLAQKRTTSANLSLLLNGFTNYFLRAVIGSDY